MNDDREIYSRRTKTELIDDLINVRSAWLSESNSRNNIQKELDRYKGDLHQSQRLVAFQKDVIEALQKAIDYFNKMWSPK